MDVPVYLFTGFLEAGKTKFIKETMQDENFNDLKRKYLIIQCEEGEEEIEPGDLPGNVSICTFEREDDLVADRIIARQKRAGADVIVTACPLCKYNLEKSGSEIPVVYITELLADALGIKEDNNGK